jgi:acetyl/propionyl-CoA carboxylase alpha subunit
MLRRVLVANRGEIALRIIRACRALGITSVAIYSEADAAAPFVTAADIAVPIGPPPATASYLNVQAVLDAARRTRADSIHPGYGFLSENAQFAERCTSAGLKFVGPPAAVIARMGSKLEARNIARRAGVPVVPGGVPASQSDADIAAAVDRVGLPALLKASAGGGGKGMRLVRDRREIADAISQARREAERAFSDGTLYIEHAIAPARHIEVQILGDEHGNLVHLFERDCSLQRRHQKVIEEAPAPGLEPDLRERITRAAIVAARAAGYVNAGTIEFLVQGDGKSAEFYFLEMNTRLQVEHPITEAITGIDIVQAQLQIASGERLPFTQDDVRVTGHACECRIYAEDSVRLLPQTGTLLRYREPAGEGVRVDSGVREGLAITGHYDPLLAKLVTHADAREGALDRMNAALRQFEILGLRHNIPFLLTLLSRDEVQSHGVRSGVDTTFIDRHLSELSPSPPPEMVRAAAALAAVVSIRPETSARTHGLRVHDPWDTLGPIDW